MTRFLRRLFRIRIEVSTYKKRAVDADRKRFELHEKLAAQLGRNNPVRQ